MFSQFNFFLSDIQLHLSIIDPCPAGEAVSEPCLACLCEAISGCDLKFRCVDNICGPFHITHGYWVDGGMLGGGNTS